MEKVMRIECPAELLLGLHVNIERLAEMVKLEAAVALFQEREDFVWHGGEVAGHAQSGVPCAGDGAGGSAA